MTFKDRSYRAIQLSLAFLGLWTWDFSHQSHGKKATVGILTMRRVDSQHGQPIINIIICGLAISEALEDSALSFWAAQRMLHGAIPPKTFPECRSTGKRSVVLSIKFKNDLLTAITLTSKSNAYKELLRCHS